MNFFRFSKNKLLLFVAFLATIAVVFYGEPDRTTSRFDYGRNKTNLNPVNPSTSSKETAAAINSPLFPFREQSGIVGSAIKASSAKSADTAEKQNKLIPVLRVIDGDTIVAEVNGQPIHIRLIGINSPEPNDKRARVACLAQKAKEEAEKLLGGQNIYLEKDPTQGDYDKYNRLLAYVFLASGTNFNKLMIEEGYAYEYTYRPPAQAGLPYKYQSEFKAAQNKAQTAKKGLWNPDICRN
ncbi:MAG: thermonuclease family protein [Patescibacteria group bacterium]